MHMDAAYDSALARVAGYFDRSATGVWERLTSDAPVSGIRATVRAGRDRMRALMLSELSQDLSGARILDAGCGTGAMAVALAERGAEVVAADISPALIAIADARCPEAVRQRIRFVAGDMTDPGLGQFDHMLAMDSMIYYRAETVAALLDAAAPRLTGSLIFTLAPRTPMLMAMWRLGKLFPRSDRSPQMVPHTLTGIASALRATGSSGGLREIERVTSGFYISTAMEFRP